MRCGTAVVSACGAYRYALHRWDEGSERLNRVLFIMLNPSTADAQRNDPTIRRCIDYAERWGHDSLDVGNLYAYRATKPSQLKAMARTGFDVVSAPNDRWLKLLALGAQKIVCAWGQLGPDKQRARTVCNLLAGQKLYALAFTKIDDQPRHPLMLRKDLVPLEYFT